MKVVFRDGVTLRPVCESGVLRASLTPGWGYLKSRNMDPKPPARSGLGGADFAADPVFGNPKLLIQPPEIQKIPTFLVDRFSRKTECNSFQKIPEWLHNDSRSLVGPKGKSASKMQLFFNLTQGYVSFGFYNV